MKVFSFVRNVKVINKEFLPDLIYVDGAPTEIDKNGNIAINENKINNVTIIWNNKAKNYADLFQNIDSIIEIDLSKFDASEVTSMHDLFSNCKKLKYINFGNINTSSVKYMSYMLFNCISLSSLDLSNLNISQVISMQSMFEKCSLLYHP